MQTRISNLKTRIFADGADLEALARIAAHPLVRGFTTNPTLMRKAGVSDYRRFALDALGVVGGRPISFEVFSDDFAEMEDQALELASWGSNVNVKIPITNSEGEFSGPLLSRLTRAGVCVNVTALLTLAQVDAAVDALEGDVPAYISVFAGRIADTGRDPVPVMEAAAARVGQRTGTELHMGEPRELLNIFQADAAGVHVITVANDILNKLELVDRDLSQYSLETVQMFRKDAVTAGYRIGSSSAVAR